MGRGGGVVREPRTSVCTIIVWQSSLEVNPHVLIGSFLERILSYGLFPWN